MWSLVAFDRIPGGIKGLISKFFCAIGPSGAAFVWIMGHVSEALTWVLRCL